MANQILLDAADLIEEKGWVRKMFECENGFCVVGAIAKNATGRFKFWR